MAAPDPASSARRIVARAALLLVPVLALSLAAPWLYGRLHGAGGSGNPPPRPDRPPTAEELQAARRAEEKLAQVERRWDRSRALAPRDAEVDASGDRVRPFQGFGISVESAPAGARVLADGKELGETPITASVACDPGAPVRVEVRKGRLHPQRRTLRCREDQLVEWSVTLR